jgi:hypothetical protein
VNRIRPIAWTLPPSLATARLAGSASNTPAARAPTIATSSPRLSRMAAGRWPLIVSRSASWLSTPSSMSTNRNSTMIAPA